MERALEVDANCEFAYETIGTLEVRFCRSPFTGILNADGKASLIFALRQFRQTDTLGKHHNSLSSPSLLLASHDILSMPD